MAANSGSNSVKKYDDLKGKNFVDNPVSEEYRRAVAQSGAITEEQVEQVYNYGLAQSLQSLEEYTYFKTANAAEKEQMRNAWALTRRIAARECAAQMQRTSHSLQNKEIEELKKKNLELRRQLSQENLGVKEQQISNLTDDLKKTEKTLKDLRDAMDVELNKMKSERRDHKRLKDEYEALLAKYNQLLVDYGKAQTEIVDLKNLVKSLQTSLEANITKISDLQKAVDKANEEKGALQTEKATYVLTIARVERERDSALAELQKNSVEIAKLISKQKESDAENKQLGDDLVAAQKKNRELLEKIENLTNQSAAYQDEAQKLQAESHSKGVRIIELESSLASMTAAVATAHKELEEMADERAKTQATVVSTRAELETAQKALTLETAAKQELEGVVDGLRIKVTKLENNVSLAVKRAEEAERTLILNQEQHKAIVAEYTAKFEAQNNVISVQSEQLSQLQSELLVAKSLSKDAEGFAKLAEEKAVQIQAVADEKIRVVEERSEVKIKEETKRIEEEADRKIQELIVKKEEEKKAAVEEERQRLELAASKDVSNLQKEAESKIELVRKEAEVKIKEAKNQAETEVEAARKAEFDAKIGVLKVKEKVAEVEGIVLKREEEIFVLKEEIKSINLENSTLKVQLQSTDNNLVVVQKELVERGKQETKLRMDLARSVLSEHLVTQQKKAAEAKNVELVASEKALKEKVDIVENQRAELLKEVGTLTQDKTRLELTQR